MQVYFSGLVSFASLRCSCIAYYKRIDVHLQLTKCPLVLEVILFVEIELFVCVWIHMGEKANQQVKRLVQ